MLGGVPWRGASTESHTLYRTRGGAFFLRLNTRKGHANEDTYEEFDEFSAMGSEEAFNWVQKGDIELLAEDVFPSLPEATAQNTAHLNKL